MDASDHLCTGWQPMGASKLSKSERRNRIVVGHADHWHTNGRVHALEATTAEVASEAKQEREIK